MRREVGCVTRRRTALGLLSRTIGGTEHLFGLCLSGLRAEVLARRMEMETRYTAFFRCALPVQVQRDGAVWMIEHVGLGNNAIVRAKKEGDPRDFQLAWGPKGYVQASIEDGFRVVPNTIRFDLFLLLAQKGQAEIRVTRAEKFDLRKYLKPEPWADEWLRGGRRGR